MSDLEGMKKQLDDLYYLYINCAGDQDRQFDAAMDVASALGLSKEFKQMIGG